MPSDSVSGPLFVNAVSALCNVLTLLGFTYAAHSFYRGVSNDDEALRRAAVRTVIGTLMIATFPTLVSALLPGEARAVTLPRLQLGWLDIAALVCFAIAGVRYWRTRNMRPSNDSSRAL
jgi:hypothetical protein